MCLSSTEGIGLLCQPFSFRDTSSEHAVPVTDLAWIIQLILTSVSPYLLELGMNNQSTTSPFNHCLCTGRSDKKVCCMIETSVMRLPEGGRSLMIFWWYVHSCRYNTRVWRSDRQTDGFVKTISCDLHLGECWRTSDWSQWLRHLVVILNAALTGNLLLFCKYGTSILSIP